MDGEISTDEVHDLLSTDADVRIVDIRDERSFRRGHVPDSVNVPFADLPNRIEELEGAERVITVCPHGKASVQAARLIGSYEGCADATVESMRGGLEAWVDSYDLARDGANAAGNADVDAPSKTDADAPSETDANDSPEADADAPF